MAGSVATARIVQGKELSYNNINDTDAAYECVAEFSEPAVVVIKHANPCGVAIGKDQYSAYLKAYACDPVSIYGGIVAVNRMLEAESFPVRVANLSSIWTVCYTRPSRYNWMLQYYLRSEGLALSWVGTGRLIFSLNYNEADFNAVSARFLAACRAMERDGWWWSSVEMTNKSIRRQILREVLATHWARISGRPATA